MTSMTSSTPGWNALALGGITTHHVARRPLHDHAAAGRPAACRNPGRRDRTTRTDDGRESSSMNLMRFLLRSSRSIVILSAIAGAAGGVAGIALIALIQRELAREPSAPGTLAWAFVALCVASASARAIAQIGDGQAGARGGRRARPAPGPSHPGAAPAGVRDDRQLGPAGRSDRGHRPDRQRHGRRCRISASTSRS